MTDADRKARNALMLTQLYPTFRRKVAATLTDLEGKGYRPRIQCAWRSPADQLAAYKSGHSKLKFGFHNVTKAGHPEALAADILDDDHPVNATTPFLLVLAASAQAHGCTTGIRWGLPQAMRTAIDKSIAAKRWDAPVKVGWDPNHVEVIGLTPTQAKSGKRPE